MNNNIFYRSERRLCNIFIDLVILHTNYLYLSHVTIFFMKILLGFPSLCNLQILYLRKYNKIFKMSVLCIICKEPALNNTEPLGKRVSHAWN